MYSKPHKNINELIALLKSRGLLINDDGKAEHFLNNVGYYRLTGYLYYFRDMNSNSRETYKNETSFSTIVDLYNFDKELRINILKALEIIEISLKTVIAEKLALIDPYSHNDVAKFHRDYVKTIPNTQQSKYDILQDKMNSAFLNSKEEFAKHFRRTYGIDTAPPIWIINQVWDFGVISNLYSGLRPDIRRCISTAYNIYDINLFSQWLRCLNLVRNICAHHSRLWNKPLTNYPKKCTLPFFSHLDNHHFESERIYYPITIMIYLLNIIEPNSNLKSILKETLLSLPNHHLIKYSSMGMDKNWLNNETIWN